MITIPLQHQAPASTTKQQGVPVLEVCGLYKAFGQNKVLNGVNLRLYAGENLVVLGKSGSGKSVLIKCIGGLIRPDAGSIWILGQEMTKLRHEALDHLRAQIGFLFQSSALYDSMTVRQNLEFPLLRHRMALSVEQIEQRVQEALEHVGLAHAINMLPAELSGGMRKRIGIARTLILHPKLLLYDEPTAGLDPVTARGISKLIVEVQQKYGSGSLIITHDMACAKTTANRILVLDNGVFRTEGTFEELKGSPDPAVREFFEE